MCLSPLSSVNYMLALAFPLLAYRLSRCMSQLTNNKQLALLKAPRVGRGMALYSYNVSAIA